MELLFLKIFFSVFHFPFDLIELDRGWGISGSHPPFVVRRNVQLDSAGPWIPAGNVWHLNIHPPSAMSELQGGMRGRSVGRSLAGNSVFTICQTKAKRKALETG